MNKEVLPKRIVVGIIVGFILLMVSIFIFSPDGSENRSKNKSTPQSSPSTEKELTIIPWTNDFSPDELLGYWKGEDIPWFRDEVDDVYVGYDYNTEKYTWRYNNDPEMDFRFLGKKTNGDVRFEFLSKEDKNEEGYKIPFRGTIEITTDGMKLRIIWEDDRGDIMGKSGYYRTGTTLSNEKEKPRQKEGITTPTKKVSKKEEYKPIQSITDIDGTWRYGDDTIYFDSKRMIVQWNREWGGGPEMKMDYIDSTDRPDYPYQEFYVYGTIGTTKTFRTRVLINESRNSIYLDRVDGNTPHYYKKVD